MRLIRPHLIKKRRLLVVGAVGGIVGSFDLREPLHAGGMID